MALAFALLAIGCHATDTQLTEERRFWRYGSMIDAGSGGSRIYIFEWNVSEDSSEEVIIPKSHHNFQVRPGIASYARDPEGAGESMQPLVEFAKQQLQHVQDKWESVPIFLRATAGMRLLTPDEREGILKYVRMALKSSPFRFHDSMASVATGEEEGVFGWLAVNSVLGNLKDIRHVSSQTTVGALDMGGASTQITFVPEKSIMQHAFPVKLASQMFHVYAVSFLHFGLREVAHQAASIVISRALSRVQSVKRIHHPCFPKHYIYKPSFSYSSSDTFPISVDTHGSSSYSECQSLLQEVFEKDAPCLVTECSFYGVYQPRLYDSKFVAFAHFAKIADFLAVPLDGQLSDFSVASEYVCSLSLHQLDMIFGRIEAGYDRRHLCFHSVYIYVLLTSGYGFEPDSSQIVFRRNASKTSGSIDMVLGAMMYAVNLDNAYLRPM